MQQAAQSLSQQMLQMQRGFFCSLHTDAENLLLILTAKGINPSLKIVSKAEEDESEDKMKRAALME